MVRKRNWSKSNKFSESHRTNLPGNFCLWDIDGLHLDDSGAIESVYEGKFKMESKDRGDFIKNFYSEKNLQAKFLQKISNTVPVWICEESTDRWWSLSLGILKESENPRKDIINTQDRIYVEDLLDRYKGSKISGVFFRTEGDRNSLWEKLSESLSGILDCPLVLVNDVFREESIFIKGENGIQEIGVKESVNWLDAWKILGLV